MIGRFCGDQLPRAGSIITTHNSLYLWFRADNSTARDGFELTWESISPGNAEYYRIEDQRYIEICILLQCVVDNMRSLLLEQFRRQDHREIIHQIEIVHGN